MLWAHALWALTNASYGQSQQACKGSSAQSTCQDRNSPVPGMPRKTAMLFLSLSEEALLLSFLEARNGKNDSRTLQWNRPVCAAHIE